MSSPWMARLRAWRPQLQPLRRLRCYLTAQDRARLKAEIALVCSRITPPGATPTDPEPTWVTAARELLGKAEQQTTGDIDTAWKYLHEADRLRIASFDSDEVDAQSILILHEAQQKLDGWRKSGVATLLSPTTGTQGSETSAQTLQRRRVALAKSTLMRDEHSSNVYFKMRVLRRQMTILSGLLLVLLIGVVTVWWLDSTLSDLRPTSPPPVLPQLRVPLVIAGLLFGGIGACLSGLISFASATPRRQIPEHLANVTITLTRPLVGAASGLIAILLIYAGLLPLEIASEAALMSAALGFGFSERLFVGALERVSK